MRVVKAQSPAQQAEEEIKVAKAAQMRADIDFVAMIAGVDIFSEEETHEQDV